ncbi:Transcription factor [Elasticomyces elasticus]|nr:Transcription factor [Elasticomyces elasticus]KAK3662100.1 Transcription factor [Elasticomyces elasticus]KAK4927537.1 Transcription factor [Elasticomyces elasticus]KAK5743689.1 Transcription factor [Elasticomyces elasticus]
MSQPSLPHHNPTNGHLSPKRKSTSSSTPSSENPAATKKAKRSKVQNACIYCRRSHMTCDQQRPCARCVKRDIGHLCHDEPRESAAGGKGGGRRKSEGVDAGDEGGGVQEVEEGGVGVANGGLQYATGAAQMSGMDSVMGLAVTSGQQQQQIAQPAPISPTHHRNTSLASNNNTSNTNNNNNGLTTTTATFDWSNTNLQNQFQDMHHLHPNYMFNTSEVTNEYNLLNDFLSSSLIDDGNLYANPGPEDNGVTQSLYNDPLLSTGSLNALGNTFAPQSAIQQQNHNHQQNQHTQQPQQRPPTQHRQFTPPHPPHQQQNQQNQQQTHVSKPSLDESPSRPPSAFPLTQSDAKARDAYFLTAADPAGTDSAQNRLHKLLKAKYDAGMLKPFNYVKGYARLQSYLSRHVSPSNIRRILEQLSRFRPKFREAMQGLSDVQLVLVEMWFERSLMEYDRVFASMAIPACCWRRTGEIFRGNREMAVLLGVDVGRLRDGRLAIHEVLAEESLVSYWEKFGAIAFDQSQKAILTSCTLKSPGPELEPASRDGRKEGFGADLSTMVKNSGGGLEKGKDEEERVRCCFSFTIRRDMHNIPSLIVGNFLPIRPRKST